MRCRDPLRKIHMHRVGQQKGGRNALSAAGQCYDAQERARHVALRLHCDALAGNALACGRCLLRMSAAVLNGLCMIQDRACTSKVVPARSQLPLPRSRRGLGGAAPTASVCLDTNRSARARGGAQRMGRSMERDGELQSYVHDRYSPHASACLCLSRQVHLSEQHDTWDQLYRRGWPIGCCYERSSR